MSVCSRLRCLDDVPRYNATCRQAVRATILPQLMTSGATVAVRVDAADHSRIALPLDMSGRGRSLWLAWGHGGLGGLAGDGVI